MRAGSGGPTYSVSSAGGSVATAASSGLHAHPSSALKGSAVHQSIGYKGIGANMGAPSGVPQNAIQGSIGSAIKRPQSHFDAQMVNKLKSGAQTDGAQSPSKLQSAVRNINISTAP